MPFGAGKALSQINFGSGAISYIVCIWTLLGSSPKWGLQWNREPGARGKLGNHAGPFMHHIPGQLQISVTFGAEKALSQIKFWSKPIYRYSMNMDPFPKAETLSFWSICGSGERVSKNIYLDSTFDRDPIRQHLSTCSWHKNKWTTIGLATALADTSVHQLDRRTCPGIMPAD